MDVLIIDAFTTGGTVLGVRCLPGHPALNTRAFLEMNLVDTLLFAVVARYLFLASCAAPDEHTALSLSTPCLFSFMGWTSWAT